MEQARYWMWTKRKHDLSSHVLSSPNPSHGDSWEEQAFAEDAAGALGGCVWPPRSYTCNFCRREFRSAQALGGHMNVHRRDRARLKESPTPQSETFPHKNNILNTCNTLEHQYQPQICHFLYNPSSDTDRKVVASPSSTIRVSAQPAKANSVAKTLAPCFFPIVEERSKNVFPSSPPWSNLAAEKYFHATDVKNDHKKYMEMVDSNSRAQGQPIVKADLSVSLNLVICRNPSSISDAEEVGASCKRRRIDEKLLTFFPKPNSVADRCHPQADVAELNPSSRDDVDLELRLGGPPKVK